MGRKRFDRFLNRLEINDEAIERGAWLKKAEGRIFPHAQAKHWEKRVFRILREKQAFSFSSRSEFFIKREKGQFWKLFLEAFH